MYAPTDVALAALIPRRITNPRTLPSGVDHSAEYFIPFTNRLKRIAHPKLPSDVFILFHFRPFSKKIYPRYKTVPARGILI